MEEYGRRKNRVKEKASEKNHERSQQWKINKYLDYVSS